MNPVVLFLILAVLALIAFQVTMYVIVPLVRQKHHASSGASEDTNSPVMPE